MEEKMDEGMIKPADWAEQHGVKVDVVMKLLRDADVPVRTHLSKVPVSEYKKIEAEAEMERQKAEARRKNLKKTAQTDFIQDNSGLSREKNDFTRILNRSKNDNDAHKAYKDDDADKAKPSPMSNKAEEVEIQKQSADSMGLKASAVSDTSETMENVIKSGPSLSTSQKVELGDKISRIIANASPKENAPANPKLRIKTAVAENKKNGRYDSKKLLERIEKDERDCFKRRRPLYYLADFGGAEGYAKVIDDLALLAQDENWSFKNSICSRKNVILDNYINQSFKRLLIEDTSNNNPENDKIKLSKKRDALLFNTGLFDHHCEPIYAMFKKIWNGFQSWKFDQFVCSETDAGLRIARDAFGRNLPKPARFYDSLENLVYNSDLEIIRDFNEHIVIKNCDRLPLSFLRQHVVGFDFDGCKNKYELYEKLRCFLECEHGICNQIFERIKEGVEKIEKKVKTNFKIAVPIYYPRFKCITMLLPLFLQDSNKADAAIVLSKHDDYYELRTILTLQMAYKDARLIVKPDSDWLQSLNIEDDVEDDDEITDSQES